MSILGNDLLLGSGDEGYNLTRSLRFRRSASAYLTRTPAGAGNRKTFTWSGWVKRGVIGGSLSQTLLGGGTSDNSRSLLFLRDDNVLVFLTTSGTYYGTITTAVFRDPSAWYHIVCSVDTTQATTANRVRFYINNVEQTATSAYGSGYVPQNQDTLINAAVAQSLGGHPPYDPHDYFDGYLTEINFIDGQALTPSSFGSTNTLTGVWQPARYTGTYGTNGFYLPFTDNSALTTSSNVGLGKDFSGNANYWVTNNISITAGVTYDSMTDVPTLTSATASNFAVLNPLEMGANTSTTNGNLTVNSTDASNNRSSRSTIRVSSGKWYFESTLTNLGIYASIGIISSNESSAGNIFPGLTAGGYGYVEGGNKITNGSGSSYGSSFTTNDIISVALDMDNGKIWFAKNGTWQASGDPAAGTNAAFTGLSGSFGLAVGMYTNTTWNANFGQRPFAYTPPTGFVALNTFNLPTSTIVKGNTVMDATLYTGTLLSNAVTNAASFKPDLVWIKSRSAATSHKLTDSVRGVTIGLVSNTTAAETTDTQGLTAFGSAGFTVGTNTDYNNLAATYVGWQWQAGQGSSSSNTNGTITSTVSVNASAGFSIATYTGTGANATVGHGLGVAPSMVVIKSRTSGSTGWVVYFKNVNSAPQTSYLYLNSTNAVGTGYAGYWNSTNPTSSVFSIGTDADVSANGGNMVAYCWTPIAGFSAFGSYTGNGSADGPFTYVGFRPKFVMIKRTDIADFDWCMYDTSRSPSNIVNIQLFANTSQSESGIGSDNFLDILSNGFKNRNTAADKNASGGTYIYMAFAETPTKFALAR
jgi:hypothetical protein